MLGWNPGFNWTQDELVNVLRRMFVTEKRTSAVLDVEHSDAKNMDDIIGWCKELGYEAKEINSDSIRVWLPGSEPKAPVKRLYHVDVAKKGTISIEATSTDEAIELVKTIPDDKVEWETDWRERAVISDVADENKKE